MHRLVGDHLEVACHHHQSVAEHPGGSRPPASDGTVEAIEDPARPFRLGVQWHPETLDDHGAVQRPVAAADQV